MSYYGYQYRQQCYTPGGAKSATKCATLVPQQCHHAGLVPCVPCPPCAPRVCTVRRTLQGPCCSSGGCVETHIVERHSSSSSSSSCGPKCPNPCAVTFPQQGREQLWVSHCGQGGMRRCPQVCAPAPQVCAPAPQVCAPAPQVCAPAPQVCVSSRQVCAPAPQVCAPAPQVCAPATLCQHSSYPYSYQWSNSYQYKCGQQ